MALELPLKVRVDVRDLWDSPKSDIRASMSSLEETLGHRIEPVVQWLSLWNELKDRYPDKATFVPSIARIVNAWYSRLSWRLDSDNFPEWTEELLELLSTGRKQLLIEPSPPPHVRPKASWNTKTSSFYLGLPKLEPPSHSKVIAAFDQDFDDLLNQNSVSRPDEGWDDIVAEPSASGTDGANGGGGQRATVAADPVREAFDERPKIDRLPKLSELSRPNEIFARTAPHILTLDLGNPLIIRCSHEATLELLCAYFNQWGKTNTNDSMRRHVLKVELVESAFCNGLSDTLVVEPYTNFRTNGYIINPTLLLAFIEGVLGYKMVHTNCRNWVYRSDIILK